MKVNPLPLAVLLVVSGLASADNADAAKGQPPRFKITTKRADDAVEVQVNKDKTVFVIRS